MNQNKSIPTKIDRTDLPRLKAYAASHKIDCVQAITQLLDLAEAFPNLTTLPRPEGGAVIPVVNVPPAYDAEFRKVSHE